MRFHTTVAVIPCHLADIVATSILEALALVSTTCSILPLGLGRQAEGLARQLVQFGDKRLAVVPTSLFYWSL